MGLMFEKLFRVLRSLELEEKVLHAGVGICLVGLFIPWLDGQRYGNSQQWNGFGFYTGFMGHAVLILELFIIAMTLSPLLGGPIIVRKISRNFVRMYLCSITSVLLVASFTILLRLTSEVSGAEIRFGIYVSILGSVLSTLYAFLKYDEQRKNEVRQLFHHPDEQQPVKKKAIDPLMDEDRPPPPPPPSPMPAEDHSLFKP